MRRLYSLLYSLCAPVRNPGLSRTLGSCVSIDTVIRLYADCTRLSLRYFMRFLHPSHYRRAVPLHHSIFACDETARWAEEQLRRSAGTFALGIERLDQLDQRPQGTTGPPRARRDSSRATIRICQSARDRRATSQAWRDSSSTQKSCPRTGLHFASKAELAHVRCVPPFFPAMTITRFPVIT